MKMRFEIYLKMHSVSKLEHKNDKATSAQNYRDKRFLQKLQALETCHGEFQEMRNNLRQSVSKT